MDDERTIRVMESRNCDPPAIVADWFNRAEMKCPRDGLAYGNGYCETVTAASATREHVHSGWGCRRISAGGYSLLQQVTLNFACVIILSRSLLLDAVRFDDWKANEHIHTMLPPVFCRNFTITKRLQICHP